ncbi:MAG: radical SAM protein [Gemmatimonadetes bacterium]|nr:radical SAM protein [Gemmatimonadota bacterium]
MKRVLTRTSGYLRGVTSHSLQPYRGCGFGNALCGEYCYVKHNTYVTRGRAWGSFLEVRTNAAASYLESVVRERKWARREGGEFGVFLSSATDPFVPQEKKYGVTQSVLRAMIDEPPDTLIVQTHAATVANHAELLSQLKACARVHITIESDRDRLPGLPAPASSVESRFDAARALRDAGLTVVITVSPLLPIENPRAFFTRCAGCAEAVIIDHFIGGDGTETGSRTRRTRLPDVMESVEAGTTELAYREEMVAIAREIMPGRVGVGARGFAGEFA